MADRRREERVNVAMPVVLGEVSGITRNVSASGIFVEVNGSFSVGQVLGLDVAFKGPGGRMALRCWAEVVWVELRQRCSGVGVRVVDASLGFGESSATWKQVPQARMAPRSAQFRA